MTSTRQRWPCLASATASTVVAAVAVSCRSTKLPKIEASINRMQATAATITRTLSLTIES